MTTAVQSPDHANSRRATAEWIVVAGVSLIAFAVLTVLIASGTSLWFDQPMLATARSWSGLNDFWNLVSNLANFPMIGVGVGLVLWLLVTHRARVAVLVVILLAIATGGSELVKQLVARPRPIKGPEIGVVYSYPSGHVLEALTILGIITLLVWRSATPKIIRMFVAVLYVFLVALVAVARVALGEHYPSDVLGGAFAGAGFLAIFAALTAMTAQRTPADVPAPVPGVARTANLQGDP